MTNHSQIKLAFVGFGLDLVLTEGITRYIEEKHVLTDERILSVLPRKVRHVPICSGSRAFLCTVREVAVFGHRF